MIIGVPKEIKNHEYRVGMAVASVRELTARNHTVFAQSGAGSGIDSGGADYRAATVAILSCIAAIFTAAAYPSDSKHNAPLPASSSQLPGNDLAFALQDKGRSPS
ncbi:hypothetical protein [Aeromonas hydrophila]|uniref:hypothetical protein n=1 Tax=Aeromonas hydrophila TaxID=644 RepID=UPI0009B8E0FD|nr:hypothetical protein [Aeromonas hydrophila]